MRINNVSFGSTFKLDIMQVQKLRGSGSGVKESLRRYANVTEKDIINLFQGEIKTDKIFSFADLNDSKVIGFLKTINIIPEKIKNF